MAQVSIIILTYNSAKYIKDLLKSLKDFAKDQEIIIVDNDSKDETVKLSRKFDEIKVFETGKNLGFAKGINFGAEKAKGDFLLFINPDAVFRKGKLEDLISVFEKNEKVGVVGGKLIDYHGKEEKSAGKFFNFFETITLALGLDEKFNLRLSPREVSKVDFVSGGFMMVEANLFKKLGGFDEKFFMYVEDMEFCYRVKKEGREVYFSPDVIISHAGQGSSNKTFAVVNIYKGILYFFKKHKSILEYVIIKLIFCSKAIALYLLGIILNNSYYKNTYKEAFLAIK